MLKDSRLGQLLTKLLRLLREPSTVYSFGGLMMAGFIGGVVFWGGFNTALEATNTETFCLSCHEMKENVYQEYRGTIHYTNRTGVRATCPDCHVPKEWVHKITRKIQASNELWHKALRSISTPEKFEAKRAQLAANVWKSMKQTDSRECRNCHDFRSMDFSVQGRRASRLHEEGFDSGKTCIDCHKGIAHRLPKMETDTFGQPESQKPKG